jgi:hypothetical protein
MEGSTMRRILLAILGDAAVVVLLLAGTLLFPRPPAWVLWVGVADETDPFVRWTNAVETFGWRPGRRR